MMPEAHKQRSEVTRLLSQISAEYEAAQRGLSGLSYGTSQHAFITARMENMGQLHQELHTLVGDVAIAMIANQLNGCSDPIHSQTQSGSESERN
jgi:L-cysteine desulfidase